MNTHNMMNRPGDVTSDGISQTIQNYCSRCGKPKDYYIGDYWGQIPPPWCTCEKFGEGDVFKAPAEQGWECPKCKRVYAPHIDECKVCNNVRLVLITRTNDYDNEDDLSSPNISELAEILGFEIEDDESN